MSFLLKLFLNLKKIFFTVRTIKFWNRKTTFRLYIVTCNSPMNMIHSYCAVCSDSFNFNLLVKLFLCKTLKYCLNVVFWFHSFLFSLWSVCCRFISRQNWFNQYFFLLFWFNWFISYLMKYSRFHNLLQVLAWRRRIDKIRILKWHPPYYQVN